MLSTVILFSCGNDDDNTVAPEVLRDYATQYNTDLALIETFLNENYVENPGLSDNEPIKISKIPAGNPGAVVKLKDDLRLRDRPVFMHGITYKLYYLDLRNGEKTKETPTRVDEILVGYDGQYLQAESNPTQFEYVQFPSQYIALDRVVMGWTEVFPYFKPGNTTSVDGQPTVYSDYGAGVIFIPSGLGYYNVLVEIGRGSGKYIPSYVPLMFTFKLYDMKRADHDGDGIKSFNEDLDDDGYFSNDDSDGDFIQNYRDVDDDNDAFLTKNEILIPGSSPAAYYPYNPTSEQPLGVPNCSGDFTTPERIRKYLDRACH